MTKMEGILFITVIAAIVLCIVFMKKRTELIVNFILRAVMGIVGFYFLNQFLAVQGLSIIVGINPATVLTVGVLGVSGFGLLYGMVACKML